MPESAYACATFCSTNHRLRRVAAALETPGGKYRTGAATSCSSRLTLIRSKYSGLRMSSAKSGGWGEHAVELREVWIAGTRNARSPRYNTNSGHHVNQDNKKSSPET